MTPHGSKVQATAASELARVHPWQRDAHVYIRAVRQFAGFLGRSPDTASVEDLRRYQLHLVDRGISPVSLNAAITGLKFFFEVTLDHGELIAKMHPVRVPRTLPVVLSREEVARLIAAAGNLKHQTALSVAYGAGLRASEVVALKVGDIDSARMVLRIEQGKGGKDRYAMLAPLLLERLRAWWRVARAQGKMLDGGWLFPGLNPIESLSNLSRYTHRVAISNRRLLALDERGVTFRWKDYRAKASTRYKTMTLSAPQFMRRFLLHVLPEDFHRIRHYGLLANAQRTHSLAQARELLHVVPAATEPHSPEAPADNLQPTFVYPHCHAAMIIHPDLRARGIDPRTARVASFRMISGTCCPNWACALHRLPPIVDGFALRSTNLVARPPRHPKIQPPTATIRPSRDVPLSSTGQIPVFRPTANVQFPIAI